MEEDTIYRKYDRTAKWINTLCFFKNQIGLVESQIQDMCPDCADCALCNLARALVMTDYTETCTA